MSNEIQEVFKQIPVITRTLVLASLVFFLGTALTFINPSYLINYWPYTIKKFQIWRPFTAFLYPSGDPIKAAMDIYALYTYSRRLEEDKFKKVTADYAYYLMLVLSLLVACNTVLGATLYMKPLIIALTYTWAQDNADDVVTFYFLKLKASYLPLLMLLLDLILAGQRSMLISGTGYVAGHMYLFFDYLYPSVIGGRRILSTPRFLKSLFSSGSANDGVQRTAFGTAFRPATRDADTSSASSTATTSGFGRFSFSGPFQGKGRRLGD